MAEVFCQGVVSFVFRTEKSGVGFEISIYVCYGYYELLWRNIYSFNCMGFHGKERG